MLKMPVKTTVRASALKQHQSAPASLPPSNSAAGAAGATAAAAETAAETSAAPPPAAPPASAAAAAAAWRSELFLKPGAPPAAAAAALLPAALRRVSVVNKDPQDDLIGALGALRNAAPGCDVCLHYSLKNNYRGSPAAAAAALERFLAAAGAGGAASVLLVSGGGARRAFDSLAALRHLASLQSSSSSLSAAAGAAHAAAKAQQHAPPAKRRRANAPDNSGSGSISRGSKGGGASQPQAGAPRWPPLYVAFNPYLPDAAAAAEERARLRAKLATGLAAGVCLQMGTDTSRLRDGLRLLQSLQADAAAAPRLEAALEPEAGGARRPRRLRLYGSVFLPTKALLARMRFRPWAGVHLSEEYLGSVAGAEAATVRILAEYARAGVVPIVEAELRRPEDLESAVRLLRAGYGESPA